MNNDQSPFSILNKAVRSQYMGIYATLPPRRGVKMETNSAATLPKVSIWVRWAYFHWSENK